MTAVPAAPFPLPVPVPVLFRLRLRFQLRLPLPLLVLPCRRPLWYGPLKRPSQLLHGLNIQRICAFFISNMAHEQYFPSYHHALPDILSAPAPIAPYGTARHHAH
jgi:hypothetical protein